jgi:hypothetical protein
VDWVYRWLNQEQKGKVWVASDIKQRLSSTLSAIGLQTDVGASRAGEPPTVTIDEQLIHLIRMPGDLNPSQSATAEEILKIVSVLLPEEDYSRVVKSELPSLITTITTSVGEGMTYQDLDLAKVRGKKGLAYLDLFQFPVQQAALQTIGYVISTQAEANSDSAVATTLILNVDKPNNAAPSKAASAPDPKEKTGPREKPVSTAKGAQTLPPLSGQPVTPEAGTPPTEISIPHLTFGAGLQYRSGQGIRPLVSVSSTAFRVPWG